MIVETCFASGINGARRHPKIIASIQNANPQFKKKDFEYNEYASREREYPTGNGHPVVEESSESEEPVDHLEQHESYLHAKHSIPLSKSPGYSAGSGLRSIAQGSADQASSAVSNQVCMYFLLLFHSFRFFDYLIVRTMIKLVSIIFSLPLEGKQHLLHKTHSHRYAETVFF